MAMNPDGIALGDAMIAAMTAQGVDLKDPTTQMRAMASALIKYIQSTATIVIKTGDSGLQTTETPHSPTSGPASDKTLSAGCIQ